MSSIFAAFEYYNSRNVTGFSPPATFLTKQSRLRESAMPKQELSTIQRSYKFRIYPNATQRKQLAVEFGVSRWIYNTALSARRDAYNWYGENNNYVSISRAVTEISKDPDFAWLKEASRSCGQQALIDLDKSYANFFAGRSKFPKFKKRSNKQSVRYTLSQRQDNYKSGEYLKITKIGKIKMRWSKMPKGRPKMATVSKTPNGQYFVSFSCEEFKVLKPSTGKSVGVDIGIKDVIVTSDGFESGAPRNTYLYARELRLAQRKLARKTKGSNRRKRQVLKVARIHAKITNSRADFLHKLSYKLVNENDVICIEDLNVAGMKKNRKLSKAVSDVGMGELRRQIEYKSNWYGKHVVKISRWFPSTKMCSDCGTIHDMPLSKRTMSCDCGVEISRDHNAALNIMAEGIRSLNVKGGTYLQPELAA